MLLFRVEVSKNSTFLVDLLVLFLGDGNRSTFKHLQEHLVFCL